jgi:hypothetical protein
MAVRDGQEHNMAIPFVSAVLDIIKGPLDKVFVDKDARIAFEHEVRMSAVQSDMAQMEVNKVEAAHASIFVAGWRPFVGWVCGSALAFEFLLRPLVQWGLIIADNDAVLPVLATEALYPVLMGMLGLGAARTVEKLKDRSRNSL